LPLSNDEQTLAATMIGYWTNFAKTGNPNFESAPTWSQFNSAVDQVESLVPATPVAESGYDAYHMCSTFWDTF
jgi:para-nitrobenzyl esterase